jgi:hypothetical protein
MHMVFASSDSRGNHVFSCKQDNGNLDGAPFHLCTTGFPCSVAAVTVFGLVAAGLLLGDACRC